MTYEEAIKELVGYFFGNSETQAWRIHANKVRGILKQLDPDTQLEKLQTELDLLRRSNAASEAARTNEREAHREAIATIFKEHEALKAVCQDREARLVRLVGENAELRRGNESLGKQLDAKSARIEELGRICETMDRPMGTLTVEEVASHATALVVSRMAIETRPALVRLVAEIIRQVQPVADEIERLRGVIRKLRDPNAEVQWPPARYTDAYGRAQDERIRLWDAETAKLLGEER